MTKPRKPSSTPFLSGPQRLNKVLAAAGLGARRQVEELIEQGRVEINGEVCQELSRKVDSEQDRIVVDGQILRRQRATYYALNKPAGVLCTNSDPEGRTRAIDLVPDGARLFPVGRLDRSSVGLVLLTNDGELAQRLAHPKFGVAKSYFVVVQGQITPEHLERLRRGIYLAEGVARVEGAKIRRVRKGASELEITLTEGKNREIRRVLARLGHKVMILRRIAIGPLRLADLAEGMYRSLNSQEIESLYHAAEEAKRAKKKPGRTSKEEDKGRSTSPPKAGRERSSKIHHAETKRGTEKRDEPKRKKESSELPIPPGVQLPFAPFDDADEPDAFFFADKTSSNSTSDNPENVSRVDRLEVTAGWDDSLPGVSSRLGGVIDYDVEGPSEGETGSPPKRPRTAPRGKRGGSSPRERESRSGARQDGRSNGRDGRFRKVSPHSRSSTRNAGEGDDRDRPRTAKASMKEEGNRSERQGPRSGRPSTGNRKSVGQSGAAGKKTGKTRSGSRPMEKKNISQREGLKNRADRTSSRPSGSRPERSSSPGRSSEKGSAGKRTDGKRSVPNRNEGTGRGKPPRGKGGRSGPKASGSRPSSSGKKRKPTR